MSEKSDHWRLPALDGVRGMAVLLVLFQHLGLARGGRAGVDLFFVLSGFLITTILLSEQRATGRIHIGRFYARRALRLLPALALMVACVIAYVAIWQPQKFADTIADASAIAVYLFNWRLVSMWPDLSHHQTMFSHVWSLSVEEQFYIFWPTLLVLAARLKMSDTLVPAILLIGIVYPAIARALLWKAEDGLALNLYFRTDLRIDGMMCGALVAWLSHRGYRPSPKYERLVGWMGIAALAGFLTIARFSFLKNGWGYQGVFTLVNVLAAIMIASLAWAPHPLLRRLFEMSWLRWVGLISYGVYLWHWPVIRFFFDWQFNDYLKDGLTFTLSFVIAAISFYCMEKPFLRLKERFAAKSAPAGAT